MQDEAAEALEAMELEDGNHVTRLEDGRVTVHLQAAVELTSGTTKKTIEDVTFRRILGKDWALTDKANGDIGKTILLAASCSGLSRAAFEEMDGDDFLRCMRVVNNMGKFQATGGMSSET